MDISLKLIKYRSPRNSDLIVSVMVLLSCRHMLNVSWENNDFSFNSNGYLVNPAMIIITLDRERQWDKVSFLHNTGSTLHNFVVPTLNVFLCDSCWKQKAIIYILNQRGSLQLWCKFHQHQPLPAKSTVISYITGLFVKTG